MIIDRPRPKPWLSQNGMPRNGGRAARRSAGWRSSASTVSGFRQPHAVHLAAAQHHAGELQVVVGRRDQAAAAALEGRGRRPGGGRRRPSAVPSPGRPGRAWPCGRASPAGSQKSVSSMPSGLEDALLQHLAQRLALDARRPGSPARRWRGCSGSARPADS